MTNVITKMMINFDVYSTTIYAAEPDLLECCAWVVQRDDLPVPM
jgi:hypothetical protein